MKDIQTTFGKHLTKKLNLNSYRMRLKNLDSTSNSNIFGDNCPIFPILFLNER
jgi:hypothetical protein